MRTLSTPIQVRFADVDMAGHVHNATYLHYFETGRMEFLREIADEGWDWRSQGLILARNEIDYKLPIRLHDTVKVITSLEKIGEKSFALRYQIFGGKEGKSMCAEGSSVMVCMDYMQQKTISIPEPWLERMNEWIT